MIANESDLDVLVDLNGYSQIDRLPVVALRPAPIVIGWFNYYATSGIPALDYLIGDAEVVDPGEESAYSEKILRVSGSYLTFDVRYPVPDGVAPPVLERGAITFGSLASLYKITPPVLDAWAAILRRLPDARLVLRNKTLGSPVNQDFLWQRFAVSGVARTRVLLLGPATHADFLETYGQIDIALDTFPYNGGTTTMEALWQGVPVLTFRGDRWASRQSASLLRAAGLDQWVAESVEEFVERAVALGESPETPQRLSDLRLGMRAALVCRPVCDTERFAANMEELFRQVVADRRGSA